MAIDKYWNWTEDEPTRTVAERIQAGEFETKVPRFSYADFVDSLPADMPHEETRARCRAMRDEYAKAVEADLAANPLPDLQTELEKEHGLTGHPKASTLFYIAYDKGHSAGMAEVANIYTTLSELLK